MGPDAWDIQVERATQDFENYLSRTVNRIIGGLVKGNYAPQSAMKLGKRALDRDEEIKDASKVKGKATRDIGKMLGVT
jgi:hypothetical protein